MQYLYEPVSGGAGRIAGTLLGALAFGLPGAAGGFLVGYAGDVFVRRWCVSGRCWRDRVSDDVQRHYLTAACAVMGHVAKADGRVSEAEIGVARQVFELLELDRDMRRDAIALFGRGKRGNFPLAWVLRRFHRACRGDDDLLHAFLEYQAAIAQADGHPTEEQQALLTRIAQRLGFNESELRDLMRSQKGGRGLRAMPQSPYRVLGVAESATPDQIRRAYRKLVGQYHPDRLQARGCSEEEIRMGASRTHAARRAYDQIRRQQGF
ncbi:co-chaperone DjlA [Aquisalimonas sp.]|uniref:co-chaperone DjlA n=1 Tax=Aquisalimonas sp. TaxID=1872621 RepID=UPI0025BBB3CA|nr:co-chaperone DjlA [Aquisalimonas sp.]